MLTIDALDSLAEEVARINGLPLEQAERFVALVGDTPELDANDDTLVIVTDESGTELAKILWPSDE